MGFESLGCLIVPRRAVIFLVDIRATEDDCVSLDVIHRDVRNMHVLDRAASTDRTLEAKTSISARERAVANNKPLNAGRELRANDKSAMGMEDSAILNEDIGNGYP